MLANVTRRVQTVSRSFRPAIATRSYTTTAVHNKGEVQEKLNEYHDQLLGANWGDYLELVHNGPFWAAERVKLNECMDPFLNDPEMGPKYDYCLKATDCMYACEDVRDHINEILELMTRKTGILGMGINGGPEVSNMDAQCEMLVKAYGQVMTDYPEFKPKIEQSVGHGLAILRMKHKFPFTGGHRFFF